MKRKVVLDHLCGSDTITSQPREGDTSDAVVGAVLTAVKVRVCEEGAHSKNVCRFEDSGSQPVGHHRQKTHCLRSEICVFR